LEFCKYIIFREKNTFTISRPAKYGGNVGFQSYQELERAYAEGKLHPQDLKNAVAEELALILEPVRRYFDTHEEAKECLETVKAAKITR
jgi:tyrosyl-tRNA synthetase